MSTLSVVIPAYNEEHAIESILDRVLAIRSELAKIGIHDLEVIVVDDGSSDRTAQIVRKRDGEVQLIQHSHNQGYGAALKSGFRQARGEFLAFLDADGTYPPEYFPALCEKIQQGADLVVGSRRSGRESKMPFLRRVGNALWSQLVTLLGNYTVVDPASGMRVFRREILPRLYPLPDGLNFTPVMSTRAIHEGLQMVEVPIPYRERIGRSKLSVIRDGTLFLSSIVWTVLTYNPVQVLGLIGLTGIGLMTVILFGVVLARLQGITHLGPAGVAALFVALVAGITGIGVFALGIIFNYLVALISRQPPRQRFLGKTAVAAKISHHFGWIGWLMATLGILLGGISLAMGSHGWDIARLWLYLLGSAMLILTGVQMIIYWILLRVLEEVTQREAQVSLDLNGRLEVS